MVKILAIDDEETCLEIIKFVLTTKGFDVFAISSSTEALKFLQERGSELDLILLDMMMPEMNGLEVLQKIRQIESTKLIPVIFQTGISDNTSINEPKSYIIKKPYKREDLLKIVALALEEHKELV